MTAYSFLAEFQGTRPQILNYCPLIQPRGQCGTSSFIPSKHQSSITLSQKPGGCVVPKPNLCSVCQNNSAANIRSGNKSEDKKKYVPKMAKTQVSNN